jgi:hypothetical protein
MQIFGRLWGRQIDEEHASFDSHMPREVSIVCLRVEGCEMERLVCEIEVVL